MYVGIHGDIGGSLKTWVLGIAALGCCAGSLGAWGVSTSTACDHH